MREGKPNIHAILVASFLEMAMVAAPELAAAPAFQAGLSAGALAGLDSLARGGQAGLDLSLAFGRGSKADGSGEEGGTSIGVMAFASWDGGLGSAFAGLGLKLGFGPSLSMTCYWEFPLGDPRLVIAEAAAIAHLGTAGLPNGLALETRLARIAAGNARRPSIFLAAGLSWSAFRVGSIEPSESSGASSAAIDTAALAEALAGKAGFAAGFRARLMLELRWGGP